MTVRVRGVVTTLPADQQVIKTMVDSILEEHDQMKRRANRLAGYPRSAASLHAGRPLLCGIEVLPVSTQVA